MLSQLLLLLFSAAFKDSNSDECYNVHIYTKQEIQYYSAIYEDEKCRTVTKLVALAFFPICSSYPQQNLCDI